MPRRPTGAPSYTHTPRRSAQGPWARVRVRVRVRAIGLGFGFEGRRRRRGASCRSLPRWHQRHEPVRWSKRAANSASARIHALFRLVSCPPDARPLGLSGRLVCSGDAPISPTLVGGGEGSTRARLGWLGVAHPDTKDENVSGMPFVPSRSSLRGLDKGRGVDIDMSGVLAGWIVCN